MAAAGVPTLPSIDLRAADLSAADLSAADLSAADLSSIDLAAADLGTIRAAAAEIGYPLLVKAVAGGGGKGMRVVTADAELGPAIAGAQREAAAAFGDGTVFLERYLPAARHVEIQVLGDQHGNLVHCFERECSIQRRHQKVIEEAPSPNLTGELRSAMGRAAVAAARTIGFHSAGTVEFLVPAGPRQGRGGQEFFFLEVNTRLQVEHPVTEAVTGLDLVRQQLLIAQGERLELSQDELPLRGHAIEARLYAENVEAGYLPASGTLHAFTRPASPTARFDSGVETGSVVGVEFDPLLAKVIVHAPTRREAALRLARVLDRTVIAGVVTNRDLLVSTLRHPAFLAGDTTTDFLDRVAPSGSLPVADGELVRLVAALVLYRQALHRQQAPVLGFMRSGYRSSVMPPERLTLAVGDAELDVAYRSGRDGTFDIDAGEGLGAASGRVERWTEGRIEVAFGGVRATYQLVRTGAPSGTAWHVHGPCGRADFVERSRFPAAGRQDVAGGQLAPMPGTVRAVAVEVGQQVARGQTLVVLEAMKMEHHVTAPGAAVVAELRCAVGDQVDNGAVLVVLAPAGGDLAGQR
jgi:propionyl-CoA carboxylase alpha chain